MTEETAAWNMGEKYYELVIAVKEQYLTRLAEDDVIGMLKWVVALYDEVYMVLDEKTAGELHERMEKAKKRIFSIQGEGGLYADDKSSNQKLFDAMQLTQSVYRDILKEMHRKNMILPWNPKVDLGKAGVKMD